MMRPSGIAALLAVRVAQGLHGRWRRLSAPERARLGPLAKELKERALDIRGMADREAAGLELRAAGERLADAMVESADTDPEVSDIEVRRLRDDLSRELERLAGAQPTSSGAAG